MLKLDVTDRDAVFAMVERAVSAFGRLDIIIHNAGLGLVGAIEEIDEEQARAHIDVNLFGPLWVCQASSIPQGVVQCGRLRLDHDMSRRLLLPMRGSSDGRELTPPFAY